MQKSKQVVKIKKMLLVLLVVIALMVAACSVANEKMPAAAPSSTASSSAQVPSPPPLPQGETPTQGDLAGQATYFQQKPLTNCAMFSFSADFGCTEAAANVQLAVGNA